MAKIGEFSHEKVSEEENQDRGRIPGGKGRNFKDFFYNITVILICSRCLFKTFVQDVCSRHLFKTFVQDVCSRCLFKPFVPGVCSSRLFKPFVQAIC